MGRFEEILLVLVILVFLFGPSKLPGLGKAVGQFMSEFRNASKGESGKDGEAPAKPAEASKPQLALPPSEREKAAKRRKAPAKRKKAKAKR